MRHIDTKPKASTTCNIANFFKISEKQCRKWNTFQSLCHKYPEILTFMLSYITSKIYKSCLGLRWIAYARED